MLVIIIVCIFMLVFWVTRVPADGILWFACVFPDAGWRYYVITECRELIAEAFEKALRLALTCFSAVTVSWG